MQWRKCPRFSQSLTSSSSVALPEGKDDIEIGNHSGTSRAHHHSRSVSMKGETKMLNQGSIQSSAKIYQFPAGGRAALGVRRPHDARSELATAPRTNEALCCDSWYHQAAIEDSRLRDH
jgi:hypothetical protein